MNASTGKKTAADPSRARQSRLPFRTPTLPVPARWFPSIGRPAAALIERWLGRPVSMTEENWRNDVVDAITELELKVPRLTSEALSRNESFGRIVVEATRIALRTGKTDSRALLLNALQNSAMPGAPSSAVQLCFLRFVDELSPLHLEALALLDAPREWLRSHAINEDKFDFCTLDAFVEECLSALGGRHGAGEWALRGLLIRGLIQQYRAEALMTHNSMLVSRATAMGREFLAFVGKPQL